MTVFAGMEHLHYVSGPKITRRLGSLWYSYRGGCQEHRDLHPLKSEILVVKASEMTINDEMQEHLLLYQSILDRRGSNDMLLQLLHLM